MRKQMVLQQLKLALQWLYAILKYKSKFTWHKYYLRFEKQNKLLCHLLVFINIMYCATYRLSSLFLVDEYIQTKSYYRLCVAKSLGLKASVWHITHNYHYPLNELTERLYRHTWLHKETVSHVNVKSDNSKVPLYLIRTICI